MDRKKRALIVDDDPVIRRILTELLAKLDVETVDVSTLAEARSELMVGGIYDVVFLDLHVHTESGFEFLDWAETRTFAFPPEILLMSGSKRSEVEERRLTEERYQFLNKEDVSKETVAKYLNLLGVIQT